MLVIEETADGQVTHTWKRLEDFDFTKFEYSVSGRSSLAGSLLPAVEPNPVCTASFDRCMDLCNASETPIDIHDDYYQDDPARWKKNRGWWCRTTCMKYYSMCLNGRGPWATRKAPVLEFTEIDSAVDWAKRNRTELLVGTIAVIAGVTFVAVACAGGGCLILAPFILFASADPLLVHPSTTQTVGAPYVDP